MSIPCSDSQAMIDSKLKQLQAEYDETVVRMQAELNWHKSNLRRQRNRLALVNRLPPEVLSSIFLMSLVTSQAAPRPTTSSLNPYARIHRKPGHCLQDCHYLEPTQRGSKPDYLELCHVCQYWRRTALGSAELWLHIEVKRNMKPKLLDFIRRQTKGLLIDLDVHYARDLRARGSVLQMISTDAGQLQSLAFHGSYADSDIQPDLLDQTLTPAPNLQSLQIVVEGSPAHTERNPFRCGTPNLRCFDSKGVIIPWRAPVLRSPCLTHLILHHTPQFTTHIPTEFVSFLRQAPQLKVLHIGHHWVCPPGSVDDSPVFRPVRLREITTLHIISNFADPLFLFMAMIARPHGEMESIKVICRKEPEVSLPVVCDFASANVFPEQVEITWGVYGDLALGFTVTCDGEVVHFDEDTGAIQLALRDLPKIALNTGNKFPFPPQPGRFRVPWSFDNLRHFSIGSALDKNVPETFWHELGSLLTLEVVQFKYAKMSIVQPFLAVMASSQGRSMFDLISISQRGSPDDPEAPAPPYPALRAITFESMDKTIPTCSSNLQDSGCRLPRSWRGMEEEEIFVRFVARQLARWRSRGQRYLDYMSFHGQVISRNDLGICSRRCRMLEEVHEGAVRELGLSVSHIMLGERLHAIRRGVAMEPL